MAKRRACNLLLYRTCYKILMLACIKSLTALCLCVHSLYCTWIYLLFVICISIHLFGLLFIIKARKLHALSLSLSLSLSQPLNSSIIPIQSSRLLFSRSIHHNKTHGQVTSYHKISNFNHAGDNHRILMYGANSTGAEKTIIERKSINM